jgi:hypothetical protein
MGSHASHVWLLAIVAGILIVVPSPASAQDPEPNLVESLLAGLLGAGGTASEDPATTPPTTTPAAPAAVVAEPGADATPAPGASNGLPDTLNAVANGLVATIAPATVLEVPAAAIAGVATVEADATGSPGDTASSRKASVGRAFARGGGPKLKATAKTGKSKPDCRARGGSAEVHDGFPNDGSCQVSFAEGGLPTAADGVAEVTVKGVTFDIWLDPANTVNFTVLSGGPFTGAFYIKGGPGHHQCTFTNATSGSCTTNEKSPGQFYGFSHLDVCVGENPPPPPPDEEIPPGDETPPDGQQGPPPEDQQGPPPDGEGATLSQHGHGEQLVAQAEEQSPPTSDPGTAQEPGEGLPFTGLDIGWLIVLSLGLIVSGVLLARKVS